MEAQVHQVLHPRRRALRRHAHEPPRERLRSVRLSVLSAPPSHRYRPFLNHLSIHLQTQGTTSASPSTRQTCGTSRPSPPRGPGFSRAPASGGPTRYIHASLSIFRTTHPGLIFTAIIQVLVQTPNRNYTSGDYECLLRDLGLHEPVQIYRHVFPQYLATLVPPGVSSAFIMRAVHCQSVINLTMARPHIHTSMHTDRRARGALGGAAHGGRARLQRDLHGQPGRRAQAPAVHLRT